MHFSFQGPIYIAEYNTLGKNLGFRNVGNCEGFELKFASNRITDTESQTGLRSIVADLLTSNEMEVSLNLKEIQKENLALAFAGQTASITGASATDEIAHASGLIAGDIMKTNFDDVSSVVVKDSAGSPVTLTLGTHYNILDAEAGLIELINVGGFTQPFKISYTYSSQSRVTALSATDKFYSIFMKGINTVNNDDMTARLFKIRFSPAETIALLNNEFGRQQLNGKASKSGEGVFTGAGWDGYAYITNPLT